MTSHDVADGAARLGARMRSAREACRRLDDGRTTLEWLGRSTTPRRTPQQISRFEKGIELPTVGALTEIYLTLRGPLTAEAADPAEFAEWLFDWLADRADHDVPGGHPLVQDALRVLSEPGRPRQSSWVPLRSVADFPGAEPVTIFFGDRREHRAKSAADCFIYSGSTTDYMYLPHLAEHVNGAKVNSDKILLRMPTDYLEQMPEIAERNLLIVGSPAVNWGARILNRDDAVFPFRIDDDVVARDEEFRHEDRMQDETFASIFWELARSARSAGGSVVLDERTIRARVSADGEDLQLVGAAAEFAQRILGSSTAKAVMNRFRSMGVLDVADQENHAQVTYGSNDFAVVTLARNPWSKDGRHRAVICGGVHGPGTASALRELLSRPERFEHHPLGAVLEVKLRLDLDWPTRFERATVSFQTREYTAQRVLDHLQTALAVNRDQRSPVLRLMSESSLKARMEFVRQVVADFDS